MVVVFGCSRPSTVGAPETVLDPKPPIRCDEDAPHPIEGHALYDDCVSQHRQVIGCSSAGVCGAALTDVRAPDGTMWRLPDTCTPGAPGWQTLTWTGERPECKDK